MILERINVGQLEANCYVLAESAGSGAVIIDPGSEYKKIQKVLNKHNLSPAFVINTHGHVDHIGSDAEFKVPVYIHKLDAPMLKDPELNFSSFFGAPFSVGQDAKILTVDDGDYLELGKIRLRVIHTPGHSPGGISLYLEDGSRKILFTGDSLFAGSIGRTDLAGLRDADLVKSIKGKLLVFPSETIVYPGHGPGSTIGDEVKNNPFLL